MAESLSHGAERRCRPGQCQLAAERGTGAPAPAGDARRTEGRSSADPAERTPGARPLLASGQIDDRFAETGGGL